MKGGFPCAGQLATSPLAGRDAAFRTATIVPAAAAAITAAGAAIPVITHTFFR